MNLWISLDKDFEELFLKLERESKEYMVIEGLTTEKLDPTRFFKGFLKSGNVADASIDPNSNVSAQNITTLLHEMGKPMQKLLSFNKIYIELKEEFGKDVADEALKAHIFGDILIHDNASTFRSYCFAYSLKDIAEKGLFFINEMKALPPKHLDSFNSLTMETCAFLTNLQNGAVGLVDYLLYSFYFWNKDVSEGFIPKEKSTYIKEQQFQKMIFEFNQPYLKINQSMYGNLTIFDREYFAGLFGGLEFPNGTYAIDFVEEFMEYQKDFLNYERALRKKKSFTFPVLTFSGIFKNDKWLDEDMAKFIVKHNMEWADVNIYKSENPEAISACCRAEFNLEDIKESKKLTGNSNSIGGTDLGTGSSLVIDINLARVGYEAKGDYAIAKTLIKRRVELAQKIHYVHREKILRKNIERDLLPNYSYGLMKLESQYATIGIASMTEFVELMGGLDKNNIGEYFFNDKGIEYLGGVTKYINELGDDTLDKYKYTQSQEVSPNESGAIRLLKKDKLYFKDYPIDKVAYSNQFCDLSMSFPISERIRVDGILANKMNGGNILHLNLGEKWGNFEDAWKFNLEVAKSGSKYWSEIRKFQYCENDHNFFGTKCPICGLDAKGDILKVVGYLVKNEYYQKERREEMDNRIFYSKKDINKLK